jgi:hypothetical protein
MQLFGVYIIDLILGTYAGGLAFLVGRIGSKLEIVMNGVTG